MNSTYFTRPFLFIILLACLNGYAANQKLSRPDLIGTITDTNGVALSEATVFIFTAGPRSGTSVFCPSCYPDCRKHEAADKDGHFKIEALDPNLIFRLLVVSKEHKPKFVPKTDPFKGPVQVALEPLDRSAVGPKQGLSGHVIDPDGKPIFGAVVNFEFFEGEEANCGGMCEGVDLVTVSDKDGQFLITSQKKFDWMTVSVEATGFARRKFFKLSSKETHELKMTEGVSVTGRILHDGKPLAGIMIGLVSVDRSDNFTGNFDLATDSDGRFLFLNVPPYQNYWIYGLMDSLRPYGALRAKQMRVASDGSTKNAGDLVLEEGLRLSGQIVLSDNQPIPPQTRLLIGRSDAWDSTNVELDAAGHFAVKNVPPESYSLSLRVPGYTFSTKNKSLDRLNGNLIGRVDHDTEVRILLEPGRFQPPDFRSYRFSPNDQPKDKPLEGVTPENL